MGRSIGGLLLFAGVGLLTAEMGWAQGAQQGPATDLTPYTEHEVRNGALTLGWTDDQMCVLAGVQGRFDGWKNAAVRVRTWKVPKVRLNMPGKKRTTRWKLEARVEPENAVPGGVKGRAICFRKRLIKTRKPKDSRGLKVSAFRPDKASAWGPSQVACKGKRWKLDVHSGIPNAWFLAGVTNLLRSKKDQVQVSNRQITADACDAGKWPGLDAAKVILGAMGPRPIYTGPAKRVETSHGQVKRVVLAHRDKAWCGLTAIGGAFKSPEDSVQIEADVEKGQPVWVLKVDARDRNSRVMAEARCLWFDQASAQKRQNGIKNNKGRIKRRRR